MMLASTPYVQCGEAATGFDRCLAAQFLSVARRDLDLSEDTLYHAEMQEWTRDVLTGNAAVIRQRVEFLAGVLS